MAVIIYQCSTCNRTIELERNKRGLETINRCVITQNCRGTLNQVNVLRDYIRGRIPTPVNNLVDWTNRKILANYVQTVNNPVWTITLDYVITNIPDIIVYVNTPTEANPKLQTAYEPTNIDIINNVITLFFDRPVSGIAQIISKSKNTIEVNTQSVVVNAVDFQVTSNNELCFALYGNVLSTNITLEIQIATSDQTVSTIYTVDNIPSIKTPWNNIKKISINGASYGIRSFNINVSNLFNTTIDGSIVTITGIDLQGGTNFVPIKQKQCIILLSNSPYQQTDIIKNKFVDMYDTNTNTTLFYKNNELFVLTPTIKTIYPEIYTFST